MGIRLRIVTVEENCVHVVNGGASRATQVTKTFDCEAPSDLVEYLDGQGEYNPRWIVGVEILR